MSDKIIIIKKTSPEKIAQLLKKREEAKDKAKKIEERIKTIKNAESKIERKERTNKLIEIAAMLVGDNWKNVHEILTKNPDKVERIKKGIEPILAK